MSIEKLVEEISKDVKELEVQIEILRDLMFCVGARVRISRKSEYAHQNNGVGTVAGPDYRYPGWVMVVFDDGYNNLYRTGEVVDDSPRDGTCDLVLVDE